MAAGRGLLRVLVIGGAPEEAERLQPPAGRPGPTVEIQQVGAAAELAPALAAGPFEAALVAADLAWAPCALAARAVREAWPDCAVLLAVEAEAAEPAEADWDGYVLRQAGAWLSWPLAVQQARQRVAERQSLRAAEARFRGLFEEVPVGLYRTTPGGQILAANRALAQMLGYPDPAALRTVNATDLYVDPQERARWQTLVRQGAAGHAFETRFRRQDGTVIWVANRTRVVRDADGRSVCYEGILEDITDRKRAELALSESEERFRTIVSQSPISVQVLTPDGWTLQVNQAWEKLWGVTAADVQHYNMLADEQARHLGMMPYVERGFAGEDVLMPPVAYHTPESLKTGRKRWFQARIYPVKGGQGEIRNVIMMYEDITEQQWATEDLQRLSAELLSAQEAERKRISAELHDALGQALTAVRINVAALEKNLGPDLAGPHRARLAEAGQLLDDLLEQVRELAHTLRPAMLDELGLVPTLRWTVSRFAERLGMEIKLEAADLDERPAPEVETVLYRSVLEAFTNIARHAQARHARLRLARRGQQVTTLIEDDGVGFDPGRPAAPGPPATGLRTLRERVALLGGTVTLESAPGRGTRLLIEVPLAPALGAAG